MDKLPCCENCQHMIDKVCTECVSKDDCMSACISVLREADFMSISAHSAWECRYLPQCRRAYSSRDAEVEGLRTELMAVIRDLHNAALKGYVECRYCKFRRAKTDKCNGCHDGVFWEWRGIERGEG